jgi:hypothetical protein
MERPGEARCRFGTTVQVTGNLGGTRQVAAEGGDGMNMSGPRTTRDDFLRRLEGWIGDLDAQLSSFEERLRQAAEETATSFRPVASRLHSTRDALGAAMQRLGTATRESWEVLAGDIERGFQELEAEVNLARTELEVELADTREAYRKALEQQLDAWRGRLDDLRVRAKLAQMEVRDEASELLDRVESAYHAARRHFDEATDDPGQTAEALRAGARAVLRDLRDSVAAARRKLA